MELLGPFTALMSLYNIARHVRGALQEFPGERASEVLPALLSLFVREF